MSEPSRSRWNELLGVPEDVKQPDLYQLLGLDRLAFDAARVDEAFREQMAKVQGVRSTKHKDFIEFLKGELRRARRVLASERDRSPYDAELAAERAAELRRVLRPALATGTLASAAEREVMACAVELGMGEAEARATIEEELLRTGASRVEGAEPRGRDAGLTLEAAAALAADEAARLAKLAAEAAERATEAARLLAEAHPEVEAAHPKKRKKKRRPVVEIVPEPAPEPPAASSAESERIAALRFCEHCGGSLPDRWRNTGEAERVGTRLLCSACSAPIRAGRACATCSHVFEEGETSVSAGGSRRICAGCAKNVQRLKVCWGCQVVLPPVAFERGEAFVGEGRFYCRDCHEARDEP